MPNSGVPAEGDDFKVGASWHVKELAVFDYFTVGNSLVDGDSIDAEQLLLCVACVVVIEPHSSWC